MINGKTMKEVLLEGSKKLADCCDQPLREARLLMRECLQVEEAEFLLLMEAPCQQQVRQQFSAMIERRAAGEPAAYIIGHREFMKLDFLVGPEVLIPRPETEILCEVVLEQAPERANILDLFTGSGCIGISLVHTLGQAKVCCVDNSEQALEYVKKNSRHLGVEKRVQTIRADLGKAWEFPENHYHIITANPPYIPTGDIAGLERTVKNFEPMTALDGGKNGLKFYESIAKNAARLLKNKGLLAVEVGIGQAEAVAKIMEQYLDSVKTIPDLQGIPRVVVGYKRKPDYTGHRERVRQRALQSGLEGFQDYELLEMLLFYIVPQRDTKAMAKALLREFDTISNMLDTNPEDLMIEGKLTANGALLFTLIRQFMARYNREKWGPKPVLATYQEVGRFAVDNIKNVKVEAFYVICLNTQRRVLRMAKIADGTVDQVRIRIQDIMDQVRRTGAKSIVLSHNHPGGSIYPSQEDIDLTQKVIEAMDPLGVEVLDHIIVGGNGNYLSMEQEGYIQE